MFGLSWGYLATRSCDSEVPIELKVVTTWLAEVSMKKCEASVAQSDNTFDVGSGGLLVLTWIV